MLYYCPTVLLIHIVLTWRNERNNGQISRNEWNARMTKEGSSQDVQSSHLQSLDQGNASLQTQQKAAKAQSGRAGPTLAGGVLPGSAPWPAILGLHRDLHSRAPSLPAAAATGHVTPWRRALPPRPKAGLFPSKRRGAGLQLRRRGSPPSCSRPPSAHLRPQLCPTARGTAGRRSPSSAARRTDFRSARRPPPAPGAWRRRRLAVSPARAATVSPRPSGLCPGRAACAGEGGEARSGDRDRDNPLGLHRSSPGEPWIPSAPGERSGRHSLGLGLGGGLQREEETATMDATAGFLLEP